MRILSESFGCSCRDSTGPNDFPHLYSSGTLKRGIRRHVNKITNLQRFYSAYIKDTENVQINDKTELYAAPENIWKIYSLCSATQLHFYLVKNPNLSTQYLTPQTQSATEVHIRGYSKTSLLNFTQHLYSQQIQMQACVEKHFTWKNVQVSGFNEWRINQAASFENNVSNIW